MEKQSKLTVYRLFWYFLLFSILGLIVETSYGYITMGIIESRKGLIWGPFCPVYGVGAVILIVLLHSYQGSYSKLFFYGILVGDMSEYVMSYLLEAMYGSRFWQYVEYHLNGRICFTYSIYWGLLAIILIKFIKPWMDKVINWLEAHLAKWLQNLCIGYMVLNAIVTVWAVITYQNRVIAMYYDETVKQSSNNFLENTKLWIEETCFSNEKMLKTFPNLRMMDHEGKEHFIRDILK